MTTHYIDILLRPDPEFSSAQLMNALYAKLHRALAALQATGVGVSFPGHRQTGAVSLGTQLRLHGAAPALEQLQSLAWLAGMRDHVILGSLEAIPPTAQFRTVQRVQAKSNPERLRRRQMKRHGLTAEQALEKIPEASRELLSLPYLDLHSMSTHQRYRLFIRHGNLQDQVAAGRFNTFGLSPTTTIPWF